MNADFFFGGAARHIVFFFWDARLAACVTRWEIKRFTVWYWQQALQRWKQERTVDSRWDSLICWSHMLHLLRCSANVERWGNLRWLWNALWPQLPFAFQHGRDGKIEMRWKGESLFRASCVNPNSGMWCNLCLPLLLPLQFSYNFQFEIFLHFIILYPKTSKCPGFSDSLILFNRFDVISHESRKPKRTAVHSADLRSGLSFDGEPQEGWHARGSLQSNFAWMYAYCTCVCYPCMSKHYKTEWYIHCFAYTHKIGFYWGKQSLIGPILH